MNEWIDSIHIRKGHLLFAIAQKILHFSCFKLIFATCWKQAMDWAYDYGNVKLKFAQNVRWKLSKFDLDRSEWGSNYDAWLWNSYDK